MAGLTQSAAAIGDQSVQVLLSGVDFVLRGIERESSAEERESEEETHLDDVDGRLFLEERL